MMNKELLEKTAQFHKIALDKISSQQSRIRELEKEAAHREAKEIEKREALEEAIEKAAEALYNSDFLTDRYSYKTFVKKALENPSYLGKTIEKVCDYKDVAGLGETSSVTVKSGSSLDEDPIYRKLFGGSSSNFNLLDD